MHSNSQPWDCSFIVVQGGFWLKYTARKLWFPSRMYSLPDNLHGNRLEKYNLSITGRTHVVSAGLTELVVTQLVKCCLRVLKGSSTEASVMSWIPSMHLAYLDLWICAKSTSVIMEKSNIGVEELFPVEAT